MKLFRGIRQTMIKKENLKRYLLYAIGEILLVMIGISLAFQLDNWNDNRVKENTEVTYYKNIKDQIEDDKELIQHLNKDLNNAYMAQFKYAFEIIEINDRTKLDTLGLIIRNMTQNSDFDRQGNIYETMVNSGEIKLLGNHEIVGGIRKLEEKYLYINRMENIQYDAVILHVVQTINPIIKFSTGEIQKPELIFNYEFQNLITQLIQLMEEKNKVYNEALDEIENIRNLINIEMKLE
jgi:hypothetical protein